MKIFSRRDWLKHVAAGTAALSVGELLLVDKLYANNTGNVVIVGGGYGGATCARYIKRYAPNINVTIIEPDVNFISCPFSNLVIAGMKKIDFITHQYTNLTSKYSINIIHDWVTKINKSKNTITLKGGQSLAYDFLVISPGVDFRWDKIEGYTEENSKLIPHAWKAGEQTTLLHNQIKAMKDGGTVLISVPQKPYRAPPAPYERASLIADYLSKHKPKSKIVLLDPNGRSEKLALFEKAWNKYYTGMVHWQDGKDAHITKVDVKNKILVSQSGVNYKGDVLNVIPPQFAASIARNSGLANSFGWCDISPKTFKSTQAKNIYVIGDSCNAGEMPKLAHAANSQAKICAVAIVSVINGNSISDPVLNTSIYSFVSARAAISEVGIYRIEKAMIKRVSGGISDENTSKKHKLKESKYAYGWYKGINRDMLGS